MDKSFIEQDLVDNLKDLKLFRALKSKYINSRMGYEIEDTVKELVKEQTRLRRRYNKFTGSPISVKEIEELIKPESKFVYTEEQFYNDTYVYAKYYKEMEKIFATKTTMAEAIKVFPEYAQNNDSIFRMADIEKDKLTAKTIPLLDLYDFQKVRNNYNKISCACPFHEEKNSSFFIYKDTNTFHCFSCKKSGDTIQFIMELMGYSFIDAVKYLKGLV